MTDEDLLAPEFRTQRLWGAGPPGMDDLGLGESSGWGGGMPARQGPGSSRPVSEIGDDELLGGSCRSNTIPMRVVNFAQTGTQYAPPQWAGSSSGQRGGGLPPGSFVFDPDDPGDPNNPNRAKGAGRGRGPPGGTWWARGTWPRAGRTRTRRRRTRRTRRRRWRG